MKEITFIDLCKAIERQQRLLEIRNASFEEFQRQIPNYDDAEKIFNAFQNAKEGYIKITRQSPSLDTSREGWTYAFAEGIPLHLDRPDEWYSTSNIEHIDWEKGLFTTLNSVYQFEFIDKL